MSLYIFFQPVAVGVTGGLIKKSGVANMQLVLQGKRYYLNVCEMKKIVLQSSFFLR